jgi:ketosteroid isomerase-like protein
MHSRRDEFNRAELPVPLPSREPAACQLEVTMRLRAARSPVLLSLLLLALGSACSKPPATLSETDLAAVRNTLEDYRQAWLAGDAERVLSHVSDSIMMFVPGTVGTIAGKQALRAFWFPASDTVYPIRKYEISKQQVYGGGDIAVVQGHSALAWETVVRDSVHSSATSMSEFLTSLRRENGQWRIFRQMYVTR